MASNPADTSTRSGSPLGRGGDDGGPEIPHVEARRFARTPWHVEDVAHAPLVGRAGSRIPGILVQRDIADGGIGLDQRLSSVAVVHIPVDDQDPFPSPSLRVTGRHHDVVDQTKPHPAGRQGMMTRRSHRGERVSLASGGVIDRSQHRTGASQHGSPAVAIEYGVEEENSTAPPAHFFQAIEVGGGVDRE